MEDLDLPCGKTSGERSVQQEERTSAESLKSCAGSKMMPLMCLDLRNGSQQDLFFGDGYSVAWRVLDAQYWGVPQRRKRIYLVADFDGDSAGKILFESEGVSGHSEKMQAARKDFARCAQGGAGETGWGKEVLNDQGGMPVLFDNHAQDSRYNGPLKLSPSLNTQLGTGGNNAPLVCLQEARAVCVPDTKTYCLAGKPRHTSASADVAMTLAAADWKDPPAVYLMSKSYHFAHATPDQADALVATDYKCPPVVNADWRVRMITPLECARLQGFSGLVD